MRIVSTMSATVLVSLLLSGQANAADIYQGSGGSLKDGPYTAPSTIYFAIRGGATFADETDFDIALGDATLNVENEYDEPGFFISGAIGVSLASWTGVEGLRGELELGYLRNDIDQHIVAGGAFDSADSFGETSAIFGLANIFYDFNQFGRIKPFLGAGIGIAKVKFDDHGVDLSGDGISNGNNTVVQNDSDTGFAYQLSAGANITITESVDLELGYRYLGITGVDLTSTTGPTSDVDVDNHIVYGGLRFKL